MLPPAAIAPPATTTNGTLAFGYEAPPSAQAALMLAEAIVPPVVASRVAVIGPTLTTPFLLATPYQVGQTGETVATFVRGEVVQQPQVVATTPATNPPSVTVVLQNRLVEKTKPTKKTRRWRLMERSVLAVAHLPEHVRAPRRLEGIDSRYDALRTA